MWNRLTRTVAPQGDVLTLDAVKAHVRVAGDVTDQDVNLQAYMAAAVRRVDGPKGIGVALLPQTWVLSLDCWERIIEIPLRPVTGVASITYLDPTGTLQTLDPSLYGVDLGMTPARVYPALNTYWPPAADLPGAIKLTFTAGFAAGEIPDDLLLAMYLLIAHWHEHREAVVGVENRDSSTPLPLGWALLTDDYRADWIS